jgi:transposase
LVERNGFEALASHKSRPSKTYERMVKRLPKEEYEKENERLRKENERLRLENLLLKKVKALVEEREARNRVIGHGPSKN